MSDLAVVVLAAGRGTRMGSSLPKVLHEAAGRPLLEHVLLAAAPLRARHTVVVVGYGADEVRERLAGWDVDFVEQREQLGTGHALLQAEDVLSGHDGTVLVLNGDGPLLATDTLQRLLAAPADGDGMALVTCELAEPGGYGRILRSPDGRIRAIVEDKDATPAERTIAEINPGTYLFLEGAMERAKRLSSDNAAGEYYLTDLVGMYLDDGFGVASASCGDPSEALGVNTRAQLAEAEAELRRRVRARWLDVGVTMIDPDTTYLDADVTLAPDVVLEPGVFLQESTHVGEGARIGAHACLRNCTIAPGAKVPPHTVATEQSFSV